MNEDMVYVDSIEFHSQEEPYKECFCTWTWAARPTTKLIWVGFRTGL